MEIVERNIAILNGTGKKKRGNMDKERLTGEARKKRKYRYDGVTRSEVCVDEAEHGRIVFSFNGAARHLINSVLSNGLFHGTLVSTRTAIAALSLSPAKPAVGDHGRRIIFSAQSDGSQRTERQWPFRSLAEGGPVWLASRRSF